MNLERCLVELTAANTALSNIDEVMSTVSLVEDDYYSYVAERIKTANTNAIKASYYYSLASNNNIKELREVLLTTAARVRKTSRALVIWILKSMDNEAVMLFNPSDNEEDDQVEVNILSIDDLIEDFKYVCEIIDITSRLSSCSDTTLVNSAFEKIKSIIDVLDYLFESIKEFEFSPDQKVILFGWLADATKLTEKLRSRISKRLGLNGQ